jgi:putative sigma-54 modulation protein
MKFIITGKNIDVTEALRDKIHEKVGKLEKFFKKETEVHATMKVQKNNHIMEVTIPFNKMVFKASETHSDMYTSIDKVVDSLERQVVKNKAKSSRKSHESKFKHPEYKWDDTQNEEDNVRHINEKKFEVKPMSVEEAVLQLEILENDFFMFMNSESKKINVIYKKKDGNFQILDPDTK